MYRNFNNLKNRILVCLPEGMQRFLSTQKSNIYALLNSKNNNNNDFHKLAYENDSKFYGGGSIIKAMLTENLSDYIYTNKNVLDLWCGQWQDGFALAKLWANVIGVDREERAIQQINDDDTNMSGSLSWIQADITAFDIGTEKYHMIVSNHALQYLDKNSFTKMIQKIQNGTEPWWYNIFSLPNKANFKSFRTMLDEKELKDLYKGREIIYIQSSDNVYKNNSIWTKIDMIFRKSD